MGRLRRWLRRLSAGTLALDAPGVRLRWAGPRVDPLTGLPDRRALWAALESACQTGAGVGVLFLDLDRFKQVNDRRGHLAGDRVLAAVAGRLQRWRRGDDVVARFGGDEFVTVTPGSGPVALQARAAALVRALRDPVWVDGAPVTCTGSVGIAHAPGPADPEALLRRADRALYAAKAGGRDRWAARGAA